MPEPNPDPETLMALLQEKGVRACPACGNPEWGQAERPLFVQGLNEAGTEVTEGGFRAIGLFCTNCGLMHLHNFAALGEPAEIAKDATGDDEEGNDAE